jgi:hypothetical protein
MTDTPQILLAHHLKALKLPTFLREYDKLARLCAAEGAVARDTEYHELHLSLGLISSRLSFLGSSYKTSPRDRNF